jgi:DNA-binding protein HU-beta
MRESTYGKTKLIDDVAATTGFARKQVDQVVNATLATIQQRLRDGQNVSLIVFGTFSIKQRSARTVRSIRTGQPMELPAGQRAHATPAANQLKPNAPAGIARTTENGTYARERGR